MSEPGEIHYACIGCGAMNPAGAEACSGCGHRFAGPDILSTPRSVDPVDTADRPGPRARPAPRPNPYEPPTAPVAPPTTFRIGTGLVVIALIAVCLALFRADVSLGLVASVMFLPSTIRTPLVAARRRSGGRPMGIGEMVESFFMTLLVTSAVVVSSSIGFVATCMPTGLASGNIIAAIAVGAVGAILPAVLILRFFLKMSRQNREREREIRYR